jgi:hypothetical protein
MNRSSWVFGVLTISIGAVVGTILLAADGKGPVSSATPGEEALESLVAQSPAVEDSTVVVRRLYEGPQLETWGHDISPDGRYLTQTDWDTGDLTVFDLLTGQPRRVTDHSSSEGSYAYAETSVYSPDGTEIAYAWCCNEEGYYEIRVIGVDGSNPRVVVPPDPEGWDYPVLLDWSPDGEHMLIDLYKKRDSEKLTLASTRDGSLRVLFECSRNTPSLACGSAAFSPDGQYIAFDWSSKRTSAEDLNRNGDLQLIPVRGGDVVSLLKEPANDQLLGWEPDGGAILFQSDRDLTAGVWRLRLIGGRPAREPELIKGGLWRLEKVGVAEGRLYYGLTTELPTLYTAGIDIEGARIVSPPTSVEEAPEREILGWGWSPDALRLAYVRSASSQDALQRELVIRSLPGGLPRTMLLPIRGARKILWAPDGRSLVLDAPAGTPEDPEWRGFVRFELQTGAYAPIEASKGLGFWATLARDLKTAYYDPYGYRSADQEDRPDALWARNLETGEEREIARISSLDPYRGYPALSPDERWVARFNRPLDDPGIRAVEVTSTETGEVREIHHHPYSEEDAGRCGIISWSPDSKYLLYGIANPASDGCTLQRVSVEGGGVTSMGDLPSFVTFATPLSPLGTRFAYIHGEWRGEIWVMEFGQGRER